MWKRNAVAVASFASELAEMERWIPYGHAKVAMPDLDFVESLSIRMLPCNGGKEID
jgi:hypothetical protein